MESTIKERLIKFIKYKKLSQRKFEQKVGLSNGYVNSVNKSIGVDKVSKIFGKFPELNRDWLMTGEGEMLLPPSQQVIGDHNNATANNVSGDGNHVGNVSTDNQIISKALDEIAAQRRLTEKAHEQIDRLLNIIEKMK